MGDPRFFIDIEEKLLAQLRYVAGHSAFYRDIEILPFTEKAELRASGAHKVALIVREKEERA